jgi:alkanesulfonate monooxygenase SsuD/methylene tetrahydromethanopterin reductase-like flavin-dependent oxidoreductase (luciferase family)
MEGTSTLFVEPLVTLAYLAGSTQHIGLGTATLIPTRHPIHMAQSVASLSWMTSRRIDVGFGAGNFQHEFDAIGLGNVDRPKLAAEQLDIARRLWAGEEVSHRTATYTFDRVRLDPIPQEEIHVWWGGVTPASTRYAIEHGDGWLPSRLDLRTYEVRVRSIREQCERSGRPVISLGTIPITSLAETRAEALARVNLAGLLDDANGQRFTVKPASGRFETASDLRGILLAGTPDDVVRDVGRLVSIGCNLIVFDLRFRFGDWLDQIRLLGEGVLPVSREPDGSTTTPRRE